jgi:hypothetical protein
MKRPGTTTFLENILELKPFIKMVMAFYFKPSNINGKNLFMLGGFSKEYYTGQMKYHLVNDESYWKLFVSEIRIGNMKLSFCTKGCYAFLDTGTSYLSFPKSVIDDVKDTILSEYKLHFNKGKKLPKLMYYFS